MIRFGLPKAFKVFDGIEAVDQPLVSAAFCAQVGVVFQPVLHLVGPLLAGGVAVDSVDDVFDFIREIGGQGVGGFAFAVIELISFALVYTFVGWCRCRTWQVALQSPGHASGINQP